MILIQPPVVQNWNSLVNKPSILSDNQISWDEIQNKPTTLTGYGITDGQPLGNELTALQSLADTPGFLKKTGNGTYSIDVGSYLSLAGGTITGDLVSTSATPSTSPTTGASRVTGGQGVQGNQYVGGFSSLGGDANHPGIKIKVLTGTTAATQGGVASIAHGVTDSKIISITALVEHWASQYIADAYSFTAGYYFDVSIGLGVIHIANHHTSSYKILSLPVKITVIYTA